MIYLSGNESKFTSACLIASPLYLLCYFVTLIFASFNITILSAIYSHLGFFAKPNIYFALFAIFKVSFAIAFVKASSSTYYAHSSAATTLLMWNTPFYYSTRLYQN